MVYQCNVSDLQMAEHDMVLVDLALDQPPSSVVVDRRECTSSQATRARLPDRGIREEHTKAGNEGYQHCHRVADCSGLQYPPNVGGLSEHIGGHGKVEEQGIN